MVRLIDADEFDKRMVRAQGECKRNGGNFRYGFLDKVRGNLAEMPTIDAIPVEWLKNRREGLIFAAMTKSNVYGDNTIELCHAVNIVLDMWQEEREAR